MLRSSTTWSACRSANYDFSRISIDEVWTEGKPFRKPTKLSKEIMDAVLTLEVNGVQELPRRYRLKRMFSVDVDQDEMGSGIYIQFRVYAARIQYYVILIAPWHPSCS